MSLPEETTTRVFVVDDDAIRSMLEATDADSDVDILSKPFDLHQLISRVRACAAPSVAGASEAI